MKSHDQKSIKTVIRSVRFSPALLELVKSECHARQVSLSEYVRQSAMAKEPVPEICTGR